MAMDDLKKAGVVVFGELYAATGLPGAVTLSKALDRAEQRQKERGIEVLIDEINKGKDDGVSFGEADADDFVQMLLRFHRAVEDGAARRNLRLLAKLIVGSKRNGALEPNRFQNFAARLQDLSRDELIVLSHAYRVALSNENSSLQAGATSEGNFTAQMLESLEPVLERRRVFVIAASLIRTGFLEPMPGLDGMRYQHTPDLLTLGKLADLEASAAHDD